MKYLYLITPRRPGLKKLCLCKIGISDNPERRRGEVEASLADFGLHMPLRCWLAVPLLSARLLEKMGHGVFSRFRSSRVPAGSSGYTEWFDIPNAATALLICFGLGPYIHGYLPTQTAPLLALAVFLLPVPIDLALLLIGVALLEWVAVLSFLDAVTGIGIIHQITTFARGIAGVIA